MQPFAQRLNQLMNEAGVSQYTLGKAIGVARQSIAQYLDGNTQPNAEKICAIADFFTVSTDYLLGKVDYRSTSIEVQGICEKTGLSEAAIKVLLSHAHDDKGDHKAHIGSMDATETLCKHCAWLTFIDRFIRHNSTSYVAWSTITMALEMIRNMKKEDVIKQINKENLLDELSRYITSSEEMITALEYRNTTLFSGIMIDIVSSISNKEYLGTQPNEAREHFEDWREDNAQR